MRLRHPEVADRSCSECRRWIFDERGRLAMRGGCPVPRPSGSQPPCHACPKKSPAEAPQYELSPRNRRLVAYFHEVRACGGQAPLDDLTRQRFGWIQQILAAHERAELAAAIAAALANMSNS